MKDSSISETESPLEENVLSEETAKEAFGEALVEEVQAAFTEESVEAFATENPKEATDTDHVLSEEGAKEAFGEELVDEVQAEFEQDAQDSFALEVQKESTNPEHLLSDEGIQALISVFWDGFQRPEEERKDFFKEALSEEEFRFFPLLADPVNIALLSEAAGKKPIFEKDFQKSTQNDLSFEYAKGLAQVSLQMGTLRELRRNAVALLSLCVGLFSVSALFAAIIFSIPHLSQGKATLLAFLLVVPVVTIVMAVISVGRVWEYFTFIQGSGKPLQVETQIETTSVLSDAGSFLSGGIKGIEEKLTENKNALLRASNAVEQAVQRLILSGCLIAFSAVVWISLAIASTFQKFLSWEHVGFFALTSFILFLVTFFVRIGQWKTASVGRTWGWCFALAIFVLTLFGAGAIARGPIRIDPNEMPEISSSWIHNFSPNGFFEGLRGWFYPGVALEWVPPQS